MKMEVKNSIKPVDYKESIEILEKRVSEVLEGKSEELIWVLEHNTVYTGGTSSSRKDLIDKNLKIIKTNRGGKYTLHSPGQKVVYFVLNLNKRKKDIRYLVGKIEKCVIDVLSEYKIKSFTDKKNIGIWVKKDNSIKKIAAIGIRVSKWVAYHGFSINVNNNLESYSKIIPCGIKDKDVLNLKSIKEQNYDELGDKIIKNFIKHLEILIF